MVVILVVTKRRGQFPNFICLTTAARLDPVERIARVTVKTLDHNEFSVMQTAFNLLPRRKRMAEYRNPLSAIY